MRQVYIRGGRVHILGFHAAEIVAQGRSAVMEGKGGLAKDMTGAVFHRSYLATAVFRR
jgi:hypothetical protein